MPRIVPLESSFLWPGTTFWILACVMLLVVVLAVVGVAVLARSGSMSRRTADRLRELQSLLDQRLITQAEYDERRRAIVEGL